MLFVLYLTHWLTVDIFVTSLKSVPFHFNWLANFWQWITWLIWLNLLVEKQLAIICNIKIVCSAFSKQNLVAKAAGGLKHLLNVSTLEIIWSSLLAPEFVY